MTRTLRPGDVLVLGGTTADRLSASNGSELVFAWFSAKLEHLFSLFAASELSLLAPVACGFKGSKLYSASSPLAVTCHKLLAEVPPQINLNHRSQLIKIAAAVLSVELNMARVSRADFLHADEQVSATLEKLSVTEILTLPVPELAGRFHCSQRHLSRLFHERFGVSVAALRMELRLLRATTLLRDPTAKIINVAEEAGFNHLGFFNTCFKRRFGISPGQWRIKFSEFTFSSAGPGAGPPACRMRDVGLCPWKCDSVQLESAAVSNAQTSQASHLGCPGAPTGRVVAAGERPRKMPRSGLEPAPQLEVHALAGGSRHKDRPH